MTEDVEAPAIAGRTSPNPELTRTLAAGRAAEKPDWVPGNGASRLRLLGWLDTRNPGHTSTTDHTRAQLWREVMKIAA